MSGKLPSLLPRRKKRSRFRVFSLLPRMRPVDVGRFSIGLGTAFVLTILLSIHFLPDRLALNVGDRSPTDIRASRSVSYLDTEATLRQRENAASRVQAVYDHDPTALAQATAALSDIFDTVRRVRSNQALPTRAKKTEALSAELGSVLTPDQARYLVEIQPGSLDRLVTTARRLVESAMTDQIRNDTDDLSSAVRQFAANAKSSVSAATEISVLEAIGRRTLRANSKVNLTRTRHAREAAMRTVGRVWRDLRAGDVVVRQGDVFTQLHMDQCTALGLVTPRLELATFASVCALSAVMVLLVGYYLYRKCRAIYESPNLLLLLASIVVFGVLGLKLFGQMLGVPLSLSQLGYFGLMMVVAAGMIVAVLLDTSLAVLVTALLSVLSGLIMNHELRFSMLTLISSLVGIYCSSNIRARGHLLQATLVVGATNVAMVWVLGGLLGDTLTEVLYGSIWAIVSGAFAVGIFWFAVMLLEKPFGILTHAWLLELSASEQPLLRELCLTAPGTYAHSIMVGNLAEAGAEAIGADGLFCRVASYYHDIGKMKRPHCFVENQHAENVHNKLSPSLSALIIASHVRDGVELAEQHRLPAQIRAVVAEHHGTSLIKYFYHQALSENGAAERHDPVLEEHFRYEGPRPQSRESGIIMLADTVEAAARCLDKPSPGRLQNLVDTLVHDKMTDGQLDECDLTFKDIGKIQAAFVRVLSAMLHGRIDYPELPRPDSAPVLATDVTTAITHASRYPELPKS